MTNIYISWAALKAKVDGVPAKTLYYHLGKLNWQLYVLDGPDVFIKYVPRPDLFDSMVIEETIKTQAQSDYNDFNSNYKAAAIETEGVKD